MYPEIGQRKIMLFFFCSSQKQHIPNPGCSAFDMFLAAEILEPPRHVKAEEHKYDNKYAQQLQADYQSLIDNINDARPVRKKQPATQSRVDLLAIDPFCCQRASLTNTTLLPPFLPERKGRRLPFNRLDQASQTLGDLCH